MRKKYIFGKKLYISVLTSILVLLTTVATTFAWVGVFANSTFESFDIDIRASKLDEYSLEISSDGVNFSDSISFDSLKKQILMNWGYTEEQLYSDDKINLYYYINAIVSNYLTNTIVTLFTLNNIYKYILIR